MCSIWALQDLQRCSCVTPVVSPKFFFFLWNRNYFGLKLWLIYVNETLFGNNNFREIQLWTYLFVKEKISLVLKYFFVGLWTHLYSSCLLRIAGSFVCGLQLLMFCCYCVQSLSHAWIFAASWTAALQAFLSSTVPWSLLKFMSSESVNLKFDLTISSFAASFSFCLQSFLWSGSFPLSQLYWKLKQKF